MDSFEDKELVNYQSVKVDTSSSLNPYFSGLEKLNVTHEDILLVGSLINSFYEALSDNSGRGRKITRNASTMLRGAVFALGTDILGNIEWKEQTSSSLREVLHEWGGLDNLSTDYFKIYKTTDSITRQKRTEAIRSLYNHYKFFSAFDHHNTADVVFSLRAIKQDQSFKPENCFSDDLFIEVFSGYIATWKYLLSSDKTS